MKTTSNADLPAFPTASGLSGEPCGRGMTKRELVAALIFAFNPDIGEGDAWAQAKSLFDADPRSKSGARFVPGDVE